MPLLKNKIQQTEQAPLDPTKKLTLKERLALKKTDPSSDQIPMGNDTDIVSGGENTPTLGNTEKFSDLPKAKEQGVSSSVGDGLPEEDTDQVVSMTSLAWLGIAPPGFGKSELFALFPENLMLACEGGHKFIRGKKMIIDEWDSRKGTEFVDEDKNLHVSFNEAIRRLLKSDRFKFVTIDTLDALIKRCIDSHLGEANAKKLSELGDYGEGFNLGQNDPIRKAINDILSTGRGIGLITHQQVNTNNFSKGAKSKKETSLPNGIHKIVFPQMDIVIHGEYGGIREGNRFKDRIWRTVGSEDILAKNRGGFLPPAFISPEPLEERAAQIKGFFESDTELRKSNVEAAYAEYVEFYGEVE